MYNRRRKNNIIIGSLLAVVCIMAVGYAAFASNLNISGSGAISSNWDIEITGIRGANPNGGDAYDISQPTYTKSTATFNTGLKTPDTYRIYEIEISNFGTLTGLVTIANLSCGDNSAIECEAYEFDREKIDADGQWKDWYDNSFDIYDGTNDYSDINFTIAPGSKHYLYIVVGYSYAVTSQPKNLSANISLELTYEQARLDSNGIAIPPFNGTVYAFNTRRVTIGASTLIDLGTSYETFAEAAASNSGSSGVMALKYTVVNDVLTEGYACFLKDGTEYCLKGKDTSAFANNVAILNTAFPTCGASESDSYCDADSVEAYAYSDGTVGVGPDSSAWLCFVNSSGNAICKLPDES